MGGGQYTRPLLTQVRSDVKNFVRDDEGASSVEYGLIVVAIAAVVVTVVLVLGGYVQGNFSTACTNVASTGITNAGTSGNTC